MGSIPCGKPERQVSGEVGAGRSIRKFEAEAAYKNSGFTVPIVEENGHRERVSGSKGRVCAERLEG